MLPISDLSIAATALKHDLTLLTTDGHFADLPVRSIVLD